MARHPAVAEAAAAVVEVDEEEEEDKNFMLLGENVNGKLGKV